MNGACAAGSDPFKSDVLLEQIVISRNQTCMFLGMRGRSIDHSILFIINCAHGDERRDVIKYFGPLIGVQLY